MISVFVEFLNKLFNFSLWVLWNRSLTVEQNQSSCFRNFFTSCFVFIFNYLNARWISLRWFSSLLNSTCLTASCSARYVSCLFTDDFISSLISCIKSRIDYIFILQLPQLITSLNKIQKKKFHHIITLIATNVSCLGVALILVCTNLNMPELAKTWSIFWKLPRQVKVFLDLGLDIRS